MSFSVKKNNISVFSIVPHNNTRYLTFTVRSILINVIVRYIDNVLKEKQRNLEDRSRRNNHRIEGIYENDKESWGDTEKKVQTFFTEKLGLKDVEIERAHRTGRKNDGRPRTIILNLQKYKDKIGILKELYRLKGTNTFVNEDFSRETVAIRKKIVR
nr:uncharacterized protein LOC105844348 [Hydra vulgaris]